MMPLKVYSPQRENDYWLLCCFLSSSVLRRELLVPAFGKVLGISYVLSIGMEEVYDNLVR